MNISQKPDFFNYKKKFEVSWGTKIIKKFQEYLSIWIALHLWRGVQKMELVGQKTKLFLSVFIYIFQNCIQIYDTNLLPKLIVYECNQQWI